MCVTQTPAKTCYCWESLVIATCDPQRKRWRYQVLCIVSHIVAVRSSHSFEALTLHWLAQAYQSGSVVYIRACMRTPWVLRANADFFSIKVGSCCSACAKAWTRAERACAEVTLRVEEVFELKRQENGGRGGFAKRQQLQARGKRYRQRQPKTSTDWLVRTAQIPRKKHLRRNLSHFPALLWVSCLKTVAAWRKKKYSHPSWGRERKMIQWCLSLSVEKTIFR